jgi:hypothetical protein
MPLGVGGGRDSEWAKWNRDCCFSFTSFVVLFAIKNVYLPGMVAPPGIAASQKVEAVRSYLMQKHERPMSEK